MDLGLEGLMLESHCNPDCALSDARQQLLPADLLSLLEALRVRDADSGDRVYKEGIDQLRAQIDILDENLLYTFASRMGVSRKIGTYKRDHNVAILQTGRWDAILTAMKEKGSQYGLSERFISEVFTAIHEESVRVQNEILTAPREGD